MAEVQVHMILSGIISFIPRGGDKILVRLQDGRSWPQHPHYANLVVEQNRCSATLPDRPLRLNDPKRTLLGAWKIPPGTIKVLSTPKEKDLKSNYLTGLLKIIDGAPGCGEAAKSPTPPGLDLPIDVGALTTTAFSRQPWYYDSETEAKARVLAHEVCWSFTIDGPVLKLKLPRLGETELKPQDNGLIELRLQNTLEDDFFPRLPQIRATDHHIQHFFEQCTCRNPPKNQFLRASKKAVQKPPLPGHSTHELDGEALAVVHPGPLLFAWDTPSDAAAKGRAANAHPDNDYEPVSPRINCPPALWESLET